MNANDTLTLVDQIAAVHVSQLDAPGTDLTWRLARGIERSDITARRFKVTEANVRQIQTGKTWGWLTSPAPR